MSDFVGIPSYFSAIFFSFIKFSLLFMNIKVR